VVLLMVLLAMMLIAVIRLPERQGSSEEDARPQSPRQRHGCAGPVRGEGAISTLTLCSGAVLGTGARTAACCLPGAGS
jgi:hypothetical protein